MKCGRTVLFASCAAASKGNPRFIGSPRAEFQREVAQGMAARRP
jgi:hypothetical protein